MDFEKFRELLSENLGLDKSLLRRETSLTYDLGVDSLSIVNFIIKLEKQYNQKFNIDNIWSLKNIGEAFDLISTEINGEKNNG